MLHFSDKPYVFHPARPSRLIIWLGHILNRRRNLPGRRHRISAVEVQGGDHLRMIRRDAGRRLVFLPNHSTHSDPQIMLEAQRQLGVTACFMAAYDIFCKGKVLAWLMQRGGCFSVDREGSDREAMKAAIAILREGEYGLTIFPEGNVYLMNDRVTPFLDGAAYLAMKAQKELGAAASIYAVPVSIKATLLKDERETVRNRIAGLATNVGTELDRDADFLTEMKRIGLTAMEKKLRQRGLIPPEEDRKDIAVLLEHCSGLMAEKLEAKMELVSKPKDSIKDRLRRIRGMIHQIRTNPDRKADHEAAITWADEAMLALRILSYSGTYVDENPTLDRFAESTEKLLEDAYSQAQPPCGDRKVYVRIGEPVMLADCLDRFGSDPRETVGALTREFEKSVQAGLDAINETNPHPGGERF